MLLYLLSISNLVFSMIFQFYIAKELNSVQSDFIFFNIGLVGVLISMSTAGFSGYLISSFTRNKDYFFQKVVFSEKFSFFLCFFSLISFLVGAVAFFWSLTKINDVSFYTSMLLGCVFFLLTLATAFNLLYQSYSYAIGKQIEYEFINLLVFILLFINAFFVFKPNMFSLPLVFFLRQLFSIIIFSKFYIRDVDYFNFNGIKKTYYDVRVMLTGGFFYKSEPLFDRTIISGISGAITSLYLTLQIYNALLGVFFKSFTSPLIVKMTDAYNNNGKEAMYKIVKQSMIYIFVISFSLLLLLFLTPALKIILSFDIFKVLIKYEIIIKILSLYFVISFFGQIISNIFYIYEDYKTPVVVSSISFCFFIPLKIYFTYHFGLIALAWLIVMYHAINTLILIFLLRRL